MPRAVALQDQTFVFVKSPGKSGQQQPLYGPDQSGNGQGRVSALCPAVARGPFPAEERSETSVRNRLTGDLIQQTEQLLGGGFTGRQLWETVVEPDSERDCCTDNGLIAAFFPG